MHPFPPTLSQNIHYVWKELLLVARATGSHFLRALAELPITFIFTSVSRVVGNAARSSGSSAPSVCRKTLLAATETADFSWRVFQG